MSLATSFFLGLVFSLFPYDYPLLWNASLLTTEHLDKVETHLKLLHNSPNIIVRIMHIITAIGLIGLLVKLYRPSESNMLFDGGSLVLYMIAIIIYLTNIVKGLRIVSQGHYGEGLAQVISDPDRMDDVNLGTGREADTGNDVLGREDNLKVLSASNTILALVLVGVIVLQVGQWYADRAEEKEREALKKKSGDTTAVVEPKKSAAETKKSGKKNN